MVPIARRVGYFPDQVARTRIQTEHVCIVSFHVNARSEDRNAPIVMLTGLFDETLGYRSNVMPEHFACLCIERVCIICTRDEHHSRNYGWSKGNAFTQLGCETDMRPEKPTSMRSISTLSISSVGCSRLAGERAGEA